MEVAVNEDETEPVVKPGFAENLAIMSVSYTHLTLPTNREV